MRRIFWLPAVARCFTASKRLNTHELSRQMYPESAWDICLEKLTCFDSIKTLGVYVCFKCLCLFPDAIITLMALFWGACSARVTMLQTAKAAQASYCDARWSAACQWSWHLPWKSCNPYSTPKEDSMLCSQPIPWSCLCTAAKQKSKNNVVVFTRRWEF